MLGLFSRRPDRFSSPVHGLAGTGKSRGVLVSLGVHAGVLGLAIYGVSQHLSPQQAPLKPVQVTLLQEAPAQPQPVQPRTVREPQRPQSVQPMPVATQVARADQSAAPSATLAPAPIPVFAAPPAVAEHANVTEARFDADYLSNPKPPYPLVSRRMGECGTVYLRVQVTPEGLAQHVELKTSSGFARLDQSAMNTVASWKFVPAKRGGVPVSTWVVVPIVFSLS